MRVTHSDIKMPTGTTNPVFDVDLLNTNQYYPYGMKIEDLSYNATGARYGYNGTHEQDLEVNANGNYLDFGNFGYDTRVARRFNLDPIDQIFISNYACFGNDPIYFSDPSGYSYCESCEDVTAQEYDVAAEIAIDEGIKSIEKSVDNALNKIFDISASITNSFYVGVQSFGSWSNLGSPKPYEVKNRKIDGSEATGKEVAVSTVETMLLVTPLPKLGRISQFAKPTSTNTVLMTATAEVTKGISVIGPRATYREFAKKIGANFLDVSNEAWTMGKNMKFLYGVVKRGDDVVFAGKYNPLLMKPSVLAQEIRYLERRGYSWTKDFSRLIKQR